MDRYAAMSEKIEGHGPCTALGLDANWVYSEKRVEELRRFLHEVLKC